MLLESENLDSLQSRQHEVGGSVRMSDTGSNQSDRGHAMNGLVAFVCIYARYGMPQTEHPVSLQRIREHVAIALLEEEEWHVAIGEQGSSTKHHYGRGVRNFGRIFFFH